MFRGAKKTIMLLTAGALVILLSAFPARSQTNGDVRTVITEFAKVVSGPGAFYNTVCIVQKGAPIEVSGSDETGRWLNP